MKYAAKRRWRTWASMGLIVPLAMSALGLASSSSAGAATAGSSGPIVVGGVYVAENFPGVNQGFQARIARFNKSGGLGGRKIQYLGATDDQDSSATEVATVQQLVRAQHVFAVTPVADDVVSETLTTFLAQNNTPMLGYGLENSWCNNPLTISFAGCQISSAGWESTAASKQIIQASKKPASAIRVALEGYNIAPGVQTNKELGEVWQKLGSKVVLNENRIPLTGVSSQAPFVQSIIASNPNVVFEVTASAEAISLAAALKAGGYKGIIYNGASYVPTALATQPSVAQALSGVYVTNLLPTGYDNTPAIVQEKKDLKAIGASQLIEIGTDVGYWDADMFIRLLQATKARGVPVTPANLVATVKNGITLQPSLPGGNGPLKWPMFYDQPQPCNSTVQGAGKTYKLFQKFTCYPPNIKVTAGTS
jgi:branched-chain amino acid transport system substrate-binding protein